MTLPEVMIASSILLVCLTSLAGLLGGSVTESRVARVRDEAANLANQCIETARSIPYDSVGVHYANGVFGDPAGEILTPETTGSFTIATGCTWVRDSTGRAAYKQLTVTVSWQTPAPGQVTLTTMVYGKSDIAISGDLNVTLLYRENSNPVQNASVGIVASDGSARAVFSDASGTAFFGQVALGDAALSVTPPAGYVVDTSSMPSITVAADALTTVIVYVQQPAQATVHVVDTSGNPVSGASVGLQRNDGSVVPTVTTNASGDALFPQLLYAGYTATVSKTGYSPATAPFTMSIGATPSVVPVSISALTGLLVRVFDTNGGQISAATVSLARSSDNVVIQQGVTGTNGQYSFGSIAAGTYVVAAGKASSFATQTQTVTLSGGVNGAVDFHLAPAVATTGTLKVTTLDKKGNAASMQFVVNGPGCNNSIYTSGTGYNNSVLGQYTLSNLAVGSYQVWCYTKPLSTAHPTVSGGQTTPVSVQQTK
jgi:type II secretory pathway pseudopilin PulG